MRAGPSSLGPSSLVPSSLVLAAALLAAGAAAARSATPQSAVTKPADACFDASEATNVGGRDGRVFHVRVNATQIWRLELQGPCLSLPWLSTTTTTLTPRVGGGVCAGDVVTVTPNLGPGPRECRVVSLRRLTPAEAAALPKRLTP
jgi:hypothetical protein